MFELWRQAVKGKVNPGDRAVKVEFGSFSTFFWSFLSKPTQTFFFPPRPVKSWQDSDLREKVIQRTADEILEMTSIFIPSNHINLAFYFLFFSNWPVYSGCEFKETGTIYHNIHIQNQTVTKRYYTSEKCNSSNVCKMFKVWIQRMWK